MAFLWNHQMFLQVFSKKVCFCCILGCFAEKRLPQMSQILTDGACLEFCEFCVLWEYCSPTDCTDQHRWLVALVVAWVWQGCHTLLHLCKSVLSVGDPSLQEGSVQICEICGRIVLVAWGLPSYRTDRQRIFSHRFHRFSQMVRVWNSVNSAFCGNKVLPRIALINTDGWLR